MTPDPSADSRDLAGVRLPSSAPEPGEKKRRPFSPKALFRRLVLFTLLLLAILLATGLLGRPFARCMKLRHAIRDALASAKEVRVIEHSNEVDDLLSSNQGKYREKIYATVVLTPGQVAELRRSLPISLDFSGLAIKFCAFQDHHRIAALQPDGSTFTVDLCFRCKELSINGEEKRAFPLRWNTSLGKFLTSLGLKPDGPWEKPREF